MTSSWSPRSESCNPVIPDDKPDLAVAALLAVTTASRRVSRSARNLTVGSSFLVVQKFETVVRAVDCGEAQILPDHTIFALGRVIHVDPQASVASNIAWG
jgi:hypothetical protein